MYQFPANDITPEVLDKIGNSLIYFSSLGVRDLNKTKILKFLFLLEESSIQKYAVPFFNIDFKVWQHGPVATDIFIDLSSDDNPVLLKDYLKKNDQGKNIFETQGEFNDDEFSKNDLDILKKVSVFSKDKPANLLVAITHGPNSLWRLTANQHGVLNDLLEGKKTNTQYLIDFNKLIKNDEWKTERYNSALENNKFSRYLKSN